MKTVSLFFATVFVALTLGYATAFACQGAYGIYSTNNSGSLQCQLTGQDANWCYYDCTCSASAATCDRWYDQLGMV
jgi:hypothetical protein